MTNKEAVERIVLMKKFLGFPGDDNSVILKALDLAIEALLINQKRLELISKYKKEQDEYAYATEKYRYWRDAAEYLEECVVIHQVQG